MILALASPPTVKRAAPIGLLVSLVLMAAPADGIGSERVYLTKGPGSDGLMYVYRPKVISLGSTGVIKALRWRRWDSGTAVGRGKGVPTSSSVPANASRRAVVRLSGRRRCGDRLIYTRVRYRVFGLRFSDRLTCTTGVHP